MKLINVKMSFYARFFASGALAPGARFLLGRNNTTETGKQAMRNAAEARGLGVYF